MKYFTKLTKKETKEFEKEFIPVSNFVNVSKSELETARLHNELIRLHDWKYTEKQKLKKGLGSTKENKKYLSKKLGIPLYHVCYLYREAVWGITTKKTKVICYYSKKGFSVCCDPKTTCKDVISALTLLRKELN